MAMAPPRGIDDAGSTGKARFHMRAMAAKASLHSMASNWSMVMPDRSRRRWVAGTGADSTMAASSAATVAWANRARTGSPSRSATDRSAISMAAAPSVICDEFPAVMSGAVSGSQFCAGGSPASASIVPRPADALVGLEEGAGRAPVLVLHRDRHRLVGEVAGVPRRGRPPVALQGVGVHVLPGDPPPVGQHLGHPELGPQPAVDLLEERRGERSGAPAGVGGQRHPAHRLDTAGHHQVVVAGLHPGGGEVHRLLGGAALAVDGGGRARAGAGRPTPRRCG